MAGNTLPRVRHDFGLSAWLGCTLANALALNSAAGKATDAPSTGAVAHVGWDLLDTCRRGGYRRPARRQHRPTQWELQTGPRAAVRRLHGGAKTAATAAALGVAAYSRVLGERVSRDRNVPAKSGTNPDAATPPTVMSAQRRLSMLQGAVPALTGAVIVISSFVGEQQRAAESTGACSVAFAGSTLDSPGLVNATRLVVG